MTVTFVTIINNTIHQCTQKYKNEKKKRNINISTLSQKLTMKMVNIFSKYQHNNNNNYNTTNIHEKNIINYVVTKF